MTTPVLHPDKSTATRDEIEPVAPSADTHVTRSGRRWLLQLFTAAVFSYLWACACNAVLNVLQTGGDFGRLFTNDLADKPVIFLLSSAVLWLLLLLLVAVTGRLYLSGATLLSAVVVLGFANYQKMRVRNEPLLPSDFAFAANTGFLADMVTTATLVAISTFILLTFLIAVLLGRMTRDVYPRITRRANAGLWRRWLGVRAAIAIVTVLLLSYVTHFNESGNLVRVAYERGGTNWAFWFQRVNYLRHGTVAGFLYNLSTVQMEQPDGYSEERMDAVVERYERLAARMNDDADRALLSRLNVVVILSESFSDPTAIPGVSLERDPIPFTRRLMDSTVSGQLLAQHFGGGTANMEYEALTGLSLSQFLPQNDTPYSMSVYEQTDYPSVVGYLKSFGHTAVGVHPYMPTMYKRGQAYEALGFDRFVTEDTINDRTRIDDSDFIADSAAFDETLLQMRATEGPDLLNVVTMQNHYPTDDVYDDPIKASGVHPDARSPLGHFARGLEHSDAAFRSFLDEVKATGEPTAVVFYGDHQPALWQDDPEIADRKREMHQAPFFLWSNVKDLPDRQLSLTSPIYFMPMLFRELGLEVPPYYALLSEMQQRVSAMENGEYFAPDGTLLDDPTADPAFERLLNDYRLVQYDFAVGERHAVSRLFPQ